MKISFGDVPFLATDINQNWSNAIFLIINERRSSFYPAYEIV